MKTIQCLRHAQLAISDEQTAAHCSMSRGGDSKPLESDLAVLQKETQSPCAGNPDHPAQIQGICCLAREQRSHEQPTAIHAGAEGHKSISLVIL